MKTKAPDCMDGGSEVIFPGKNKERREKCIDCMLETSQSTDGSILIAQACISVEATVLGYFESKVFDSQLI